MRKNYYEAIRKVLFSTLSSEVKVKKLERFHNGDIAEVLMDLTKEERLNCYKLLGVEKTAEIFSFYDNVDDFLTELSTGAAADVLETMDSDEAFEILEELDDNFKTEIINLMEDSSKKRVQQLDSYDEDFIGSYMSDNYITINKNYSIKQAMSKLVEDAYEHDNITILYVTDDNNKLYGTIKLTDLIVARKDESLENLCMTSCPYFFDDELMEDCLTKLKDYAEDSIPIVDKENRLLGVILANNLIHVVDEEMQDDYAKLGGLSESEDSGSSIFSSIKKRVPWLIILLFLGVIVSSVIGAFEAVIAVLPVIVFFQSIVLDMAGNVGTQSLAVTIRNISNEKLSKKEVAKVLFREVRLGFFNGLIIALLGFIFVLAFLTIRQQEVISGDGFQILDTLKVSGIISFSILLAMTISSFIGTIFPIFLDKIHIDPAVASGPFITTFNDIIAILVYYGLAYILFMVL